MASPPPKTAIEQEYDDIVKNESWPGVFHKLSRDGQWATGISYDEAKRPENNKLNRYRNVYPYDRTRVMVKRTTEDYINANTVDVNIAKRRYILTQGPLHSTVNHFWSMIWEQNSRGIIMLNKIIENNEIKCHWYWPQDMGSPYKMWLEAVNLTVQQIDYQDFDYYCMRLFVLTDVESGESREVMQFHYTTWPDFGVPASPDAFLDFLDKVRAQGVLEPEVGPTIVHCSAGIGRSGTFCLVDSSLVLIERGQADRLRVQEILLEMRQDRMGLIQTPEQLRFSYEAIIEGERRILTGKRRQYDPAQFIFNVGTAHHDAELDTVFVPVPPPRSESLATASTSSSSAPTPPERPLPSIPRSASLDQEMDSDSSSSDPITESGSGSSDESDANDTVVEDTTSSTSAVQVRRRKNATMAARLKEIREKVKKAERWNGFRFSVCRPLTITAFVVLAGVFLYQYFRH